MIDDWWAGKSKWVEEGGGQATVKEDKAGQGEEEGGNGIEEGEVIKDEKETMRRWRQ